MADHGQHIDIAHAQQGCQLGQKYPLGFQWPENKMEVSCSTRAACASNLYTWFDIRTSSLHWLSRWVSTWWQWLQLSMHVFVAASTGG